MLAKRIVAPFAVPTAGAAAAVAGVLNADAAETTACSVTYAAPSQWNGFIGDVKIGKLDTSAYSVKIS